MSLKERNSADGVCEQQAVKHSEAETLGLLPGKRATAAGPTIVCRLTILPTTPPEKLPAAVAATTQQIHSYGGAERDRTADLLVANEALSQLSYSPTPHKPWQRIESISATPLVYQAMP